MTIANLHERYMGADPDPLQAEINHLHDELKRVRAENDHLRATVVDLHFQLAVARGAVEYQDG